MEQLLTIDWVRAWMMAFVVTLLVEVCVVAPRLPVQGGARVWRAALPSTLTHPVIFWGIPTVALSLPMCAADPDSTYLADPRCWNAIVLVAEVLVVVAEGALLRAMGARRPWLTSLVANVCSVAAGWVLRGGWG